MHRVILYRHGHGKTARIDGLLQSVLINYNRIPILCLTAVDMNSKSDIIRWGAHQVQREQTTG